MHDRRQYKVTDYRFGLLALTLRERVGLTQAEVAEAVGVSERAIQHWEGGTAFPAAANLQKLIALYLSHGAFAPGQEHEEAKAFWKQADESAARRKSLFDEGWFDRLLIEQTREHEAGRQAGAPAQTGSPTAPPVDWGEAPDAAILCGREGELATLRQWVLRDRCRVVVLLGMGGIGKTTLATRFAQDVVPYFELVVWRSLRHAPSLQDLLTDCIQALAEGQHPPAIQSVEHGIKLLLDRLRARRCLLVLDDVESLFETGSLAGGYRPEHVSYRALFQRLGGSQHQSCVLLTSRETPRELEPLEGKNAPVRALKVRGLGREASQELLEDRDLFGTPEDWDDLVKHYGGNPLALKIVAGNVRDLFGGDLTVAIAAYKHARVVEDGTLEQVLEDQFKRLSSQEQTVLRWLAIEREPVGLDVLDADLAGASPRAIDLLSSLRSLLGRSLIERSERGAIFGLQPEIQEFVTRHLVADVTAGLTQRVPAGDLWPIMSYALLKGGSEDYVRESQRRAILQPVLDTLLSHAGSAERLEERLHHLLDTLRSEPAPAQGYAGGNLVNLLVALRGHLRGVDCSDLVLQQAYLRGVDARDANLARSSAGETIFTEPLETIVAAVLSPNGEYMALGSFTGQIRVRRVADGKPLWTGQSGTRMAWALAFSPDAARLASGDYQGQVKIWDTGSGTCLRTLEGHDRWVRAVAFSPDGALLASAGDDATIRIWKVSDGTCRHVLQGHTRLVWSIAFSPDGTSLLSGASDGTVRLWDVNTGRCRGVLQRHTSGIYSVAFHPGGALCASGTEDGQIALWNARTLRSLGQPARQGSGPASLAFNPEGTLLVSGSTEGMVEVWEIGSGRDAQPVKVLSGHSRLVNSVSFASDGLLATSSYGGRVLLWDVAPGAPGARRLRTIEGYSTLITAIAFSPDSSLLAQGDDNGLVYVWDVRSGRRLVAVQGHPGPVWALAFSPDGQTLISGGDDASVRVWQATTGRHLRSLPGHNSVVWAVAVSPDGAWLATGGAERVITLWRMGDPAERGPFKTLEGAPHWIWSLAFAPDGSLLASGHTDGSVELWDREAGQRVRAMQHGPEAIGTLRFSRDGETLLTSSNQAPLTRWSVQSGERLGAVRAENFGNWIKAVAIDPDGTLLLSGSDDQTLQLWKAGPGDDEYSVTRYGGHSGAVWAVAFSPDGSTLASSDDAGITILRDRATGAERCRLSSDRPYERMNIRAIQGLNDAQIEALRALGAVEIEGATAAADSGETDRPKLVLVDAEETADPPARQSI